MLEIFSTRELALGIYLVLFIILVFTSKKIRPYAIDMIKVACSRQLAVPFFLMLAYAAVLVYALSFLNFWKWKYLKDVIIWVLFAGVPVCFNAISKDAGEHYFLHIITGNFKFAVLAEFFLGIFTFSLPVEMILQLALFFLFAMQAIAEKDKKYKQVNTFLNWIIVATSVMILYFTAKKAVSTYSQIGSIDLLVSFFIPILLSTLYLPIAYFFAVYSKYQILFIRMSFKSSEDKKLKFRHKLRIVSVCRLSYNKVCKFEREYVNKLYVRMPEIEFDALITEFSKGMSYQA